MSCHRALRFVFSTIAALTVFAASTSRASALTETNIPTNGNNNSLELNCLPFPGSLSQGATAWISDWNPTPLTMYVSASYGALRIKDIPVRDSVDIFSEPVCVQGDVWVRINYGNYIGWVIAVNRDGSYNLIPTGIGHDVSPILETTCPPSIPSLLPGDIAWISDWNPTPLT